MKNIKIVLFSCMIIWISSCEDNSNNELDNSLNEISSSCFLVDSYDTNKYDLENKWIFLGFLNKDTKIEDCKPDNLREMNIEFYDTKKFSAKSSCNSFSGCYSVSCNDSLIIESLATTFMYCMNDTVREWEDKYFNELKDAEKYNISGNILTIETTSYINLIFKAD